MSAERNLAVPASYLILKKDDKILLARRKGSGYYDGWYSVPAGHIEAGELPIDALVREVKEEVGITIKKENTRFAHAMYRTKHDPTGDRADYFFVVTEWEGEPTICEPHKCDDVQWFPVNALPTNIMHHVREAIEYIEKGETYSELGLDKVVKSPS
jgi:8-oxo-dGTP diphosphatase